MIHTTLETIARVVGGEVVGNPKLAIIGAEFDSRRVKPGNLFCALAGAATHGHVFVPAVKTAGAAAALVEDITVLTGANISGVVVPDSLIAMQKLAAWWREDVGVPVLAITGSVGKTTTKEIAAAILSTIGKGTFSQASFNNHVGVPYTLLQVARDDAWAVVEIGMNHRGEIAPLSRLAAPNVAVITMIAPAHIGNLGSLETIAQEKLDIAAGLKPGGTLVLNSDCELLAAPQLPQNLPEISRVYFGASDQSATNEMIVSSSSPTSDGIALELQVRCSSAGNSWSDRRLSLRAPLFGTHHATNVAAALIGSLRLVGACQKSLACEQVTAAIEAFQVPEKRFVRVFAKSGGEIFDDSYNANPTSMRAFFEATKPFYATKQRWGIVLGEMRELGDFSSQYHREVAEMVLSLKPPFVIAVGEDGAKVYETVLAPALGARFARSANSVAAVAELAGRAFDVLLVKGARGVRLERLVQAIAR